MQDEYPNEFYDLVDQYVASGRYGGRPEAADAVRREHPDLCPSQRSKSGMTTISNSNTGGSAESQLTVMAKQIMEERRVTFARAYVEALNSDASLYVRYLKEQQAKLAPGDRRG